MMHSEQTAGFIWYLYLLMAHLYCLSSYETLAFVVIINVILVIYGSSLVQVLIKAVA